MDNNGEELVENRSFDFVSKDWIIYNEQEAQLRTKFMPPPYNSKTTKILHDLVKSEAAAPDDCP